MEMKASTESETRMNRSQLLTALLQGCEVRLTAIYDWRKG
jgi:hypothetical protein